MKWINAKEDPPRKHGKIVVKIGDSIFFGQVYGLLGYCRPYSTESYYGYFLTESYEIGNGKWFYQGDWKISDHLKEPEFYCYLPED